MSEMALLFAISCNEIDSSPIIEFKDIHVLQALLPIMDENGDGRISQKEVNDVRDLYLSGMGILSFDEISYFQNLEFLHLNDNQLTSIDVSKNTALIDLRLCNNQLTSIDVSKNTALECLELSGNQLTSIDVSKNTALRSLSLSDNQLTSIDVSKNTALDYLILSGNQLRIIDLSKNKIINYVLKIDGNPLQKLILSYYNLHPEDFKDRYKDIIEYVYE